MKRLVCILLAVMPLAVGALAANGEKIEGILGNLHWYGQSTFKLNADLILYLDPWRLPRGAEKADLILVTHSHGDHLSPQDINNIKKSSTILIAPESVKAAGLTGDVRRITPGQEMKIGGVEIRAIPAYNLEKQFHLKAEAWVGYVLRVNEVTIYHAGDTDFIPEMEALTGIDIALLPMDGEFTMNVQEAARAAAVLNAAVTVPMHYFEANTVKRFCELYKGRVELMKVETK